MLLAVLLAVVLFPAAASSADYMTADTIWLCAGQIARPSLFSVSVNIARINLRLLAAAAAMASAGTLY